MISGELQTFTMRLVDWEDEAAERARALIAYSFRKRLGAYPNLNHKRYLIVETLFNNKSTIAACSSISFAGEQMLFSENYLSGPIQKVLANRLEVECPRSSFCEIGSLATNPRLISSVKFIVAYFPWFAYRLGCEFALVTVTSYMREALADAGASFEAFCKSDPKILSPNEKLRWGKYYDFDPQTGVIDLKSLDFLNQVSSRGAKKNEVSIKLGCFAGVGA